MSKMNPVVHFEMPAEDKNRMAKFYTKVFGWKIEMLGPEMGEYVVVTTTESDENGPKRPGAINGGFYEKKEDWPAQYPSIVIAVDDIKESMKKVAETGGKVLGEPMEIPGIGQYVSFFDTEGNRVSMLQPAPRMAVSEKEQQSFVLGLWGVRYQVKDVSRSVEFYTKQLGLKLDQQTLPAFAQVSIGDLKLILSGPGASGSRHMPDGRHQEPGGWNRVVLQVADLPGRIQQMKQAGFHFRNQMEVGPGGKQIQLEDPDGNPIELFEPAFPPSIRMSDNP